MDPVRDLLAALIETACSDLFLSWLGVSFGKRAFTFELRDVPAESPLWGALLRANAEHTRLLALQPRDIYTLPYLDLAGSALRAGAGGFPPGPSLKSLDKHRRWLEHRGRLRIELLRDPGEALAAFETLTELLHARWQGQGAGSALDSPRARRFHRHVIPLLLADGRLRMIRISIDMRTVAVLTGWRSADGGDYLAGYDRPMGRPSTGQITLASAIDLASREGAAEFDFLKASSGQVFWPVRERASMDADASSHHFGSQFSRAVWASREAAAGFAKSARHLFSRPADS